MNRMMLTACLIAFYGAASIAGGADQGMSAAISLYEHGKYQEGAAVLARLSGADSQTAELHLWLGKAHIKLRRWDDAIREFEKAVALNPQSGLNHLWLGRAYGEKASRVFFLSAFDLAKKTRQEFEAAVRLAPDDVDSRFDLLEYYAEAPGFLGGGREKAEAQAAEIAGRAPRIGHSARARLYRHDKEWDRAKQELIQATETYPKDPGGFADLAEFLLQRRDFQGAEVSAGKALALNQALPAARMLLAASQVQLNRNLDQACQALQELAAGSLADHDPAFEDVYYWLGRAFLALGRKVEARQAFQTSLRFNPDHSQAKAALAPIKASTQPMSSPSALF